MKTEKQVCSIAQAKRLKELGVYYPTPFRWRVYEAKRGGRKVRHEVLTHGGIGAFDMRVFTELEQYPAFSVAELGEMLKGISIMPVWQLDYCKPGQQYSWMSVVGPLPEQEYASEPTEAQARAALLIRFLEEAGHIMTPAEVNNRLKVA